MQNCTSIIKRTIMHGIASILMVVCTSQLQAQSAAKCDEVLKASQQSKNTVNSEELRNQLAECCNFEKVEEELDLGNTDIALFLLKYCLKSDPGFKEEAQKISAYEKMALIHLDNEDKGAAKSAVRALLDLDDTYAPDTYALDADFAALVADEKEQRTKRKSKKWYWISGAVLTGGVAAALWLRSGEKQLPGPPGPPERP